MADRFALRLPCKRPLLALLVAASLFGAAPARADTAAGLAEFGAGRFSDAVTSWREAAGQGDAAASLYLGVLYDTGFGVPQNAAEALGWYRRGAASGNRTAMLNTALMIDAGRGTAADPAAAVEWYEQAARNGSGRASYNLGLLYENGIGVAPDRARARRYFRDAVAHGVAEGRTRLGERSAAVGPAVADPAMVLFGRAQQALLTRGPKADMEAATLFRRAAEAGNPLAAYNLGYCFEHGIGVSPSVDQAMTWYRKAAEGANDPALRDIALAGANNLLVGVDQVQR